MLQLCLALVGALSVQDGADAREALRACSEKLFHASGYTFEWHVLDEEEQEHPEEESTSAQDVVGHYVRGQVLELVRNGSSMFRRNAEVVFQGKTGPWKMIDTDNADEIAAKKNPDAEAQRRRTREVSSNFDRERFVKNLVRQASCPVPHEILHAILGSCVPVQQSGSGDELVFTGPLAHYVCRLLMAASPGGLGPQLGGTFEVVEKAGVLERMSFVFEIKPTSADEERRVAEEERPPRHLQVVITAVGTTRVEIPPEAERLFTEDAG